MPKKTGEFEKKLERVVEKVEARLKSKNDTMPLKNEDRVMKDKTADEILHELKKNLI